MTNILIEFIKIFLLICILTNWIEAWLSNLAPKGEPSNWFGANPSNGCTSLTGISVPAYAAPNGCVTRIGWAQFTPLGWTPFWKARTVCETLLPIELFRWL